MSQSDIAWVKNVVHHACLDPLLTKIPCLPINRKQKTLQIVADLQPENITQGYTGVENCVF